MESTIAAQNIADFLDGSRNKERTRHFMEIETKLRKMIKRICKIRERVEKSILKERS